MKILILLATLALLIVLVGVADARLNMKTYNSANSGGGGTLPACSNSADLSQACNSATGGAIAAGGFL